MSEQELPVEEVGYWKRDPLWTPGVVPRWEPKAVPPDPEPAPVPPAVEKEPFANWRNVPLESGVPVEPVPVHSPASEAIIPYPTGTDIYALPKTKLERYRQLLHTREIDMTPETYEELGRLQVWKNNRPSPAGAFRILGKKVLNLGLNLLTVVPLVAMWLTSGDGVPQIQPQPLLPWYPSNRSVSSLQASSASGTGRTTFIGESIRPVLCLEGLPLSTVPE